MKPKKALFFTASIVIFVALLFAISCKKEFNSQIPSVVEDSSSNLSIQFAHKFFYKSLRKTPINNLQITSTADIKNAKIFPFWHKAISSTTDKYSFVEVPITSYKSSFIIYSFTGKNEAKRISDPSVLAASFKRLIIYRDKQGNIDQRIVTYIPDREYLLKHQNDASKNQINKLDRDFSGYLEYSNWDQNRLFVLRIVNGKAVKKINLGGMIAHHNSGPAINSISTNKLSVNGCTMICEPEYFTTCVSMPDEPGVEETCTEELIGNTCYEDCSGDNGDPDPGGDPCLDPTNFNNCGGGGGTGAPPTPVWPTNLIINTPPPGQIITDVVNYLKVFNKTAQAVVNIYVAQPTPHSTDTWSGSPNNPDVGHTFISIEQAGKVRVFGFYPNGGVNPLSPGAPGALVDDSGHHYDVKITVNPVSAANLSSVIDYATHIPAYNLNTSNCTDFGITIASKVGVTLPDVSGSWPGGGGSNPGNLGESIRSMPVPAGTTINTTGGTAISNAGQ